MAKNDTDDVLDFINSLPDSKSGTPRPTNGAEEKGEDLLEFLDELAALDKPKTPSKSKSFEPKKKDDESGSRVGSRTTAESLKVTKTGEQAGLAASGSGAATGDAEKASTSSTQNDIDAAKGTEHSPGADAQAPELIGSISSWWSKEGSSKVSLLWGSFTSNAERLSEQTYQLASSTTNQINQQRQRLLAELGIDNEHVVGLASKLNSVLVNMSQQIADGLAGPSDELLNVLLVHDLYNIRQLDRLCQDKFSQVTGQVEGGIKVNVSNFNHRDDSANTDFNMFHGKVIDGEKLCFANLESSIKDYVKVMKVEEEARKSANEETGRKEGLDGKSEEEKTARGKDGNDNDDSQAPSASPEVNSSNIFISIQPISTGTTAEPGERKTGPILIEASNSDSFSFTLILKDITNDITVITKTQPFPVRWSRWVCGDYKEFADLEEIDPSEWVRDWIGEGLGLAFGVVAQEYVVKRMGY